jgi:protein phosphatase 2C-like protein
MSTTGAPVVPILTAGRPKGSRPSEDRIFTTEHAVIVLDGASQPDPSDHDGGWLADQLGTDLAARLRAEPAADLPAALAQSIQRVVEAHDLRPGDSPSTTVAVVRWDTRRVDVLVLCDSLVIVSDRRGQLHEVRDDRLAAVTAGVGRPNGFNADSPDAWRALVAGQRRQRNRPGGYWVAEADPGAAHHAVTASWPKGEVAVVLAMTDGVSKGVERYGVPPDWAAAVELAADEPGRLVDTIHDAEASDPHGERWPRSKRHDDKALAVIRFDLASRPPMRRG